MYVDEVKQDILFRLRRLSDALYRVKDGYIDECNLTIEYIEKVFLGSSEEEIKKIFGSSYNFGYTNESDDSLVPFYLYMEIIQETLDKKFKNKINKEQLEPLIAKFKKYMNNTRELSVNKKFDHDKHLDENFIENLMVSKGKIFFSFKEDCPNFIVTTFTNSDEFFRQRRDGEYEPTYYTKSYIYSFLYKEDKEEYEAMVIKQNNEIKELFTSVVSNRFIGGKIPKYSMDFDAYLLDKDIPGYIKELLKEMILDRRNYSSDSYGELEWMKAHIKEVNFISMEEKYLERKREEEVKKKEEEEKVVDSVVPIRARREALKEMYKLMKEVLGFNVSSQDIDDKKGRK